MKPIAVLALLLVPSMAEAQIPLRKMAEVLPTIMRPDPRLKPCGDYFLSVVDTGIKVVAVIPVQRTSEVAPTVMILDPRTLRVVLNDKQKVPFIKRSTDAHVDLTLSNEEYKRSRSCLPPPAPDGKRRAGNGPVRRSPVLYARGSLFY